MEKRIKIGEKEYLMKASAFTQFSYKNFTGRSFLSDIQKLVKLKDENTLEDLTKIDDISDLVLKIAFIMIREADKTQAETYEGFLMTIDGLFDNPEWLEEVILLACSPLSRQLQKQ